MGAIVRPSCDSETPWQSTRVCVGSTGMQRVAALVTTAWVLTYVGKGSGLPVWGFLEFFLLGPPVGGRYFMAKAMT